MQRLTRWAALQLACLACAAALLGYGAYRVYELERSEVDYQSPTRTLTEALHEPAATRISARLGVALLAANQRATFELCGPQPLDRARFEHAFELAVLHLEEHKLMLRVP